MEVVQQVISFFLSGLFPDNPTAATVVIWCSLVGGVAKLVISRLSLRVPGFVSWLVAALDKGALNSKPLPKDGSK